MACNYNNSEIVRVYLLSKPSINYVIDSELPKVKNLRNYNAIAIDSKNISYTESVTLDERYTYTKQLTFSVSSFQGIFENKRYAIIELANKERYFINPDREGVLTYSFVVNNTQNQTDYTLDIISNLPSVVLDENLSLSYTELSRCRYAVPGISSIDLFYFRSSAYAYGIGEIYTKDRVSSITENSLSYTETLDAEGRYDSTISFTIPFDGTEYHYRIGEFSENLVGFIENLYTAVVRYKNGKVSVVGFDLGLNPSYTVGENTYVTIDLKTTSDTSPFFRDEAYVTPTVDTAFYFSKKEYVCQGNGIALYILKQEKDIFGNAIDNYQALYHFEDYLMNLGYHIVGTFYEEETFPCGDCIIKEDVCAMENDIPVSIDLRYGESAEYGIKSLCDWEITPIPTAFTVSPSRGIAGREYTITVTNNSTSPFSSASTLYYGDKIQGFTFRSKSTSYVQPSSTSVSSIGGTVYFSIVDSLCDNYTLSASSDDLSMEKTNGGFTVKVPPMKVGVDNPETIVYTVRIIGCDGGSQTVTINQVPYYYEWRRIGKEIICENNVPYEQLTLFTGTTQYSLTRTIFTKKGNEIVLPAHTINPCTQVLIRWVTTELTVCINGKLYRPEYEEISYNNGEDWERTGMSRNGTAIGYC